MFLTIIDKRKRISDEQSSMVNGKVTVFLLKVSKEQCKIVCEFRDPEQNGRIIGHLLYSPDLEPLEYHLFKSLRNYLSEEKWFSRVDVNDISKTG